MKKIFLTAGAILSFLLAGAQTKPVTTPQQGNKPVTTEVMEENKREMEPKTDVLTNEKQHDVPAAIQPGMAKTTTLDPVTTDHVKSTPDINRVRDTTTVKKAKKSRKQ